MDIADNLELSFEEQCFLQLDKIRDELQIQDTEEVRKRWLRFRLYRHNIYEDISFQKRERLDKTLRYTLSSMGDLINRNLERAARVAASPFGSTPTPVSDLTLSSSTSSSRSRTESIDSGLIDPVGEVVVISSDEEVDSDDDYFIKRETDDHFISLDEATNNQACSQVSDLSIVSLLHRPKALMLVDRMSQANYVYDRFGVIHMKCKRSVKFNTPSLAKQALLLHVIAKVLKLMDTDAYSTKRELYYLSLPFCRVKEKRSSQSQPNSQLISQRSLSVRHSTRKLDSALDDICCLVGCSKIHLHIVTQPKGLVFGSLRFRVGDGPLEDCAARKDAVTIPSGQEPIVYVESDAKFILVLEKDCVLQKIIHQEAGRKFVRDYRVILVTGKGYPDINTRAFLNFLWLKLQIPVLALTDADPHGLEIVCSYKFGCYATAYESATLTVPHIKWLGLLPGDVNRLCLPDSKTIPQTQTDVRKINSLIARPYIKSRPLWMKQLQIMRDSKRKAELESLDSTGEYLVKTYLPNKLRYASWL